MLGYIYIIKNTINNKVYIGQTSRTIQYRFQQHINNAIRQEKDGMIIYDAIRKYGPDKFYIEELEHIDIELLNERERYWIQYYNSLKPNGYNIREGGDDVGRKEVYQIDMYTNKILRIFPSATNAADECNLDLSQITKVCRREKGCYSCGNYKWSYVYNYDPQYIKNIKGKVSTHPVCQVDLQTGLLIKQWDSIRQASLELYINSASISNCLIGKNKTAGGFQWCNIEDLPNMKPYKNQQEIYQYDKKGNLIKKWNNIKEAALSLGKEDVSHIRNAARGKRKTAYGYIWKYEGDINA